MKLSFSAVTASILTLASILPTSAYAHPRPQPASFGIEEATLSPRAQPIFQPGINIYHSPNGRMRVFGLLLLPKALFDVFSEYGSPEGEFAKDVFQHFRNMMDTDDRFVGIAYFGNWVGLFDSSTSNTGVSIESIDHSGGFPVPFWAEFVQAATNYWQQQPGLQVTVQQVADAGAIGPQLHKRLDSDMEKRQQDQICATPTDLRQYFSSSGIPGIPSQSITC